MTTPAKVAFLGMSVMGYPMAAHLKNKGGHDVTVYNRTTAKAEKWAKEFGGSFAATPAEALDIVETKPFERESKQVNEDTGEIRLTRWYGKFYDENLYVSRDIKKVTGRKGQATAVEVTYLD